MTALFISYRRKDTAPTAGRLYDRLREEFGKENLFMDIDTIGAGSDFADTIERAIEQADVLLAVIGSTWSAASASDGENSLQNPDDYVRKEIAAALRHRKLIIPVLVDEAAMPASVSLPAVLQPLSRLNAVTLSNTRFDADFEILRSKLLDAMDTAGVTKAQTRICHYCESRVSGSAIKCPSCGKLRKDVERERAFSLTFSGVGIGMVLLVQLNNDLPAKILLPLSALAVVCCVIGLVFAYRQKKLTGSWF
ncbi:MAG: toll/interleukin-1 receptor domain-containing protein [Acidiferrobacterales bacterium]